MKSEVTQAHKDLFRPLMSEKMSKWALLPAEVQAKAVEFHMKAQSDEALKAEFVAETEATFKAADTDGNGLLNKATYSDYVDKVEQNYKARFGGAPEANEEIKGNWFAAMNAITPEVDGVSLADQFHQMKVGIAMTQEMMMILKKDE